MRTPEASFDAIGTRWSIHVDGPLDVVTRARVHSRIASYDAVRSRFRDDSVVAQMSREPGTYRLPITHAAPVASAVPSSRGTASTGCEKSASICTTNSAPAESAVSMPSM